VGQERPNRLPTLLYAGQLTCGPRPPILRLMGPENALRRRLADLVAFDTQNPSGNERPLALHLARELAALGADNVEAFTAGRHHGVLARFGSAPKLLLNAHIDTVPANTGYSAPPHRLVERDGRLYGLGSADTKGAIAAILDALAQRRAAKAPVRDLTILFSGDEEKGATVARSFLASPRVRGLERVIVCEPTGCRVGHRHRGIAAIDAVALSPGGHSSRADFLPSPMVILARAAVALDELGKRHRALGSEGFRGLCVNVAGLEGGLAFNVIPARARLTVSVRPPPGSNMRAILGEMESEAKRAAAPEALEWTVVHENPPFATRDLRSFEPLLGERTRSPIDLGFWTEAALYAGAGLDAVVFGPGDIAQAHAADEYVEIAQLETARDAFSALLS
jgi:acetylornithine deacetylase